MTFVKHQVLLYNCGDHESAWRYLSAKKYVLTSAQMIDCRIAGNGEVGYRLQVKSAKAGKWKTLGKFDPFDFQAVRKLKKLSAPDGANMSTWLLERYFHADRLKAAALQFEVPVE